MLNLTLYYQTKSLYEDFFLASANIEIIVPGPVEADELRKILPQLNVLTIAEFLRNVNGEHKATRKSDLYHYLGIICKNLEPELKLSEFDEIFKWLTDIRNNITEESILNEIFSSFDERSAKLLSYCSEFIESSEFYDEAKLYKALMDFEINFSEKNYIFFAFKHFSSIQLDFLGRLGEGNNISVTCPQAVYKDSEHNDWVQWGSFQEVTTIDTEVEKLARVMPLDRSRLSSFLNSQDKLNELHYYSSDMSLAALQNSGPYNAGLKFSVEYFKQELDWLEFQLKKHIVSESTIDLFFEKIESLISHAVLNKESRKLKLLFDLRTLTRSTQDLTDSFTSINSYLYRLLVNVLELNLPRISLMTEGTGALLKKSRAGEFSQTEKSYGFLDSAFLDFTGGFDSMPIELKKKLAQLGVIKRSKVEESYNKFVVDNFLSFEDRILIFEDTEEFRELYKDYSLFIPNESQLTETDSDYLERENEKVKAKYFSASRLQTYIDCPRRYFYQYETKKLKENVLGDEVTAFEKGNWEHLLIKRFFEEGIEQSDSDSFINTELDTYLAEKTISLGEQELYKSDSKRRILNGINFVKSLVKEYPNARFEFEKDIKSNGFLGSIDLYISENGFSGVIDFKRSKGSIPTFSEVKNLQSIQVLTYINRVLPKENYTGGYFCLDTPEDSLFFGTSKGFLNYKSRDLTMEFVGTYSEFEKELINKIESDPIFPPRPRKSLVCNYCQLRNLCLKQ